MQRLTQIELGPAARTILAVVRVLNLDLDFFVHGVEYCRSRDDGRLDPDRFPPWELGDALAFLHDRCLLAQPLPGFVVEHHGELFAKWRRSIQSGRLDTPFHVSHVDSHADLGSGDMGIKQIETDLLFRDLPERLHPVEGGMTGLGDGNFLLFAIACRWISDLAYVHNLDAETNVYLKLLQDYDGQSGNIELKAVTVEAFEAAWSNLGIPEPTHREPLVPFTKVPWTDFHATEPYDVICLSQSPPFTPAESDVLFNEIRTRFVDETAFA